VDPLAITVLRRFRAFKYQPRESKQSKVDRLWRLIREQTGIGRGMAEDMADAMVRGRDLERLKYQKGWPIESGSIQGPHGIFTLDALETSV
jgi:hypothetical protein